jgi:hypothetical protein
MNWRRIYYASPGKIELAWFRLTEPGKRAARVVQASGQWQAQNHAGTVYGVFRSAVAAMRHADKVCG